MCCGVDGASAGYSIEAMNDGKALAASGIIGALGDSLYTYSSAGLCQNTEAELDGRQRVWWKASPHPLATKSVPH